MSKFRRLMMLFAISAGAELPREVIREAIYGWLKKIFPSPFFNMTVSIDVFPSHSRLNQSLYTMFLPSLWMRR